MSIFFTADHHFGHAKIIRYEDRPFRDVGHMNQVMIDNWNKVVREEDTVYVLGDFALGKIDESLKILDHLSGKKILLVGNHDRPFLEIKTHDGEYTNKDLRRSKTAQERYLTAGFDAVMHNEIIFNVDKYRLRLNHFPYFDPDAEDVRYQVMHPTDDGETLLHGHVHSKWAIKVGPKRGLQINVGVDVNDYTPVSLDKIIAIKEEFGG